jgi:hypothetical protein
VLEPIVSYVQSRQQQGPISVDELAGVLKLPASSTHTVTQSQSTVPAGFPPMSGMPSGLVGFNGMPIAMGGSTKSRGKSPAEAPPDNERCQYRFTRGANKGSQCASRKEPGIHFCGGCKKKKTAQSQMVNGNVGQQGGMPSGLPGMPPGMNSMMNNFSQQPMQNQTARINVTQLAAGVYRENKYGLALKTGTLPNEYICYGVISNPQEINNTSPLTQEHMDYCKQMNLSYLDLNQGNAPPVQSSGQQGLPSMTGFGQQGLPSMTGFGQQGLPSMQGSTPQGSKIMGLPHVPAVQNSNNYPSVLDNNDPDDPTDDSDDE